MAAETLHPIVARMGLSDEQRPAVLAGAGDVVVTAGAGAGKTRTLVARYLSLLARGFPLREVVAITFTQKAAREMRNRVRDQVRRYLDAASTAGVPERQRWQAIYAGLDAARIGTIHSLCTDILRAHPAEARIDPRFEVLDEGQGNILRARAVDETLAWAADDPQAVALFALLGERMLRDTLVVLLEKRLDAAAIQSALPADLLAHWRDALAERQQAALQNLHDDEAWQEAVGVVRDNAASDADDRLEGQRQLAVSALGTTGSLAERLAALSRLNAINLQGGRQTAWPGGAAQRDAVKAALKALRALWQAQEGVLGLALTPLDEALAQAYPALLAAFDYLCERYAAFKRDRGALDFDDLEQGALALLEQHARVRARWQGEVKAILVDEFQDTNGRQRDLVRHLDGGAGKLFLVGDAKQSIYRFRGADVAVFQQESARIDSGGGTAVALDTSYRAHRALVEGLNDLLRPVLSERPAAPWVAPFAPLSPHRDAPASGAAAPYIELHLAIGSKSDGALDRAADALAARIVALAGGGSPGGSLGYGDVAILCRASTSFAAYENALDRAGVPFLTVAGRGFYGRPEVRDLLNALRTLADPTDDLALVGLLRSPACALSDLALYRLAQARGRGETLWTALRREGSAWPEPDRGRAARAAQLIADLHGQVGRWPVADLLKALLDESGYRAALLLAGQARAARNVAKLLADAHASGIVGVGEFLDYVDGLRDSGTREGEARATAEGAVQIMSVHAAKGLEFPIVAIGDVTYGGRKGDGVLLDPALGILLPIKDEENALPALYRLGQARADEQEQAEIDRLFYVAATRAQELLLLSGCISLKKDGTPGSLGGWLGAVAGPLGLSDELPAYDLQGTEAVAVDLQVGQTLVAGTVYEPGWVGVRQVEPETPAPAAGLVFPPPLLGAVTAEPEQVDERAAAQDRSPPQRVWRVAPSVQRPRAPAWVVGSLVHEALAAWRFPEDASSENIVSFEAWVLARARGYGLTDERQLQDALRQCRRLLRRFRDHRLYAEMDGAERRLSEVPYSLPVDGRVENGIIDALYCHDGVWTIVEFKTDRVRDAADVRRLLAEKDYVAQARRYVAALRALLGVCPRCVLCWLNDEQIGVRLYGLDEEMPDQSGEGEYHVPQNQP